jgi:DNA-binding IclR family transcriptional regulator
MADLTGPAADLMLTATVLVMLADGTDSEAEHAYLQTQWERSTGTMLDDTLLMREIDACRRDPEAMWRRLGEQAQAVELPAREAVFKGAILCLLADAEMDIGEMTALRRMAQTLAIENYKRLMSEVWRTARS